MKQRLHTQTHTSRYDIKRVLFLCTGNSCRSQMAEGWARHFHGELFEVFSAGTEPKGVDLRAVAVMAEAGVDIADHRSRHVNELLDISFDLIVTVCDLSLIHI